MASETVGEGSAQAEDGALRGGVVGSEGEGQSCDHAAGQHDGASLAPLDEVIGHDAGGEEDPGEIHIHHAVPLVEIEVGRELAHAARSGVGEQRVDPSECGHRAFHSRCVAAHYREATEARATASRMGAIPNGGRPWRAAS